MGRYIPLPIVCRQWCHHDQVLNILYWVSVCLCMSVCLSVRNSLCVCVSVHMYWVSVCEYMYMFVFAPVCVCVCTCVCTCVFVPVCVCLCFHFLHIAWDRWKIRISAHHGYTFGAAADTSHMNQRKTEPPAFEHQWDPALHVYLSTFPSIWRDRHTICPSEPGFDPLPCFLSKHTATGGNCVYRAEHCSWGQREVSRPWRHMFSFSAFI